MTLSKTDSEVLRDVAAGLARIEGVLDGPEGLNSRINQRLNDHTRRIRFLEHYAWVTAGVVLVLSFLLYNVSATHTLAENIEKHRIKTEQEIRDGKQLAAPGVTK